MKTPRTYTAEETTDAKNLFVKTGTGDRSCLLNDTAGGITVGISDDDLVDGDAASVVDTDGDETFLIMAETCDEGAEIKSNAAGLGIGVETNATPENQWVGAIARRASGAANDIILVRKVGYWKYA